MTSTYMTAEICGCTKCDELGHPNVIEREMTQSEIENIQRMLEESEARRAAEEAAEAAKVAAKASAEAKLAALGLTPEEIAAL